MIPPHQFGSADYLTTMVAIFGTTISPYLFFWQAAEEVEDINAYPRRTELIARARAGQGGAARASSWTRSSAWGSPT